MNLVLLVEGAETEPQTYEAWLRHRLPECKRVANVSDLEDANSYVLVSGNGYPSAYRRIEGLLRDIHDFPGRAGAFWLCLDSDEERYEDRFAEAQRAVDEAAAKTGVRVTNPSLDIRILVQHCCIETWFLGHAGFLREGPQRVDLARFKRFHDVSVEDPESMEKLPGYPTRQSFHLAYLREMFAERRHRYSKRNPGPALEPNYFDALVQRAATGHVQSFVKLLDALRAAGALRSA